MNNRPPRLLERVTLFTSVSMLAALLPLAAVSQQTPADSGLGVVAVEGVTSTGPDRARFDFGEVDRLCTPTVSHTFLLRNVGAAPLTIDRVEPSCSCLSALLQSGGASAESATLAPRAQASVRVTVALANLAAASSIKGVLVYVHGNTNPVLTLEVIFRL